MKRRTDLNVISQQRAGLFGAAILWIMLFHSTLRLTWPPLHLIKATGYAGVDVFLFLSGIGLYYSMEKDPFPARFYRKRARRVLLPYGVVAVLYEGGRCLLGRITPAECLSNITLVSYWTRGVPTYWFIAAIVALYAAYPLLYKLIQRKQYPLQALILALSFAAAWLLYQDQPAFYRVNGFVFRIPIFLLGCYIAPAVKRGAALPQIPTLIACVIIAAACWYLWIGCDPWFFRMYLFIPLSISLTLFGSILLSNISKNNPIQRILHFFGGMTLELYLVHEKLLSALTYLFPNHTIAANALAFLLAVALAKLLRNLCEKALPPRRKAPQ